MRHHHGSPVCTAGFRRRHTVACETPHWNLRSCSFMRKGRSFWVTKSNPPAVDSRSAFMTSLDLCPPPPPSHLCFGVHCSSQLYGETSTNTPSGRTSLAHAIKKCSGSGRRQSKFAASTASCRPYFPNNSESAGALPPSIIDFGNAHASATKNSTLCRSIPGSSAEVCRDSTMVPSVTDVYCRFPTRFIKFAVVTNDCEKSTPTTSRKCFVSSNDAPPTAHPTSRARPDFFGRCKCGDRGAPFSSSAAVISHFPEATNLQCSAHRSAHLSVNRSASRGPSLHGNTSCGSPKWNCTYSSIAFFVS
mmetsp:Transcript_6043/g.22843  ORF Transcript_6043/g.22843 Transcript_6043/m.22843 type:complete len:304 (+) Transcript_6043:1385-2296(+)